jgi:hypothetical protein
MASIRAHAGWRRTILAVALSALPTIANAQGRYAGVVDSILAAWKTADLVCLGEDHGRQWDSDLRIALVRHPAFPRTVRVIVVESANPVHQDLLDRFILDGAPMSRAELAPVWRDASGAEVWESPIYEAFLRAVREVNLPLPREQQVRVIGGDSRIDWASITRAEDLVPLLNRGGNIRRIVAEQVLDRRLSGLAIYGAGHCVKLGGGFPGELASRYDGKRIWSIWPLEAPSELEKAHTVFGLGRDPAYVSITGTIRASVSASGMPTIDPALEMGDVIDAVVYHGEAPDSVARADLTELKAKYGAELERRATLIRQAFQLWQRRP